MGIRVGVAVISTSFLLGILFTHWIADSVTLWKPPLTEDHLRTAVAYYSLFSSLPQWMTMSIAGVAGLGALSLLASLQDGRAGNVMFDGASLFLYGCTVLVYWRAVVPNLSIIGALKFPITANDDLPFSLKQPTMELATSHLICSVALTGVLVMQAGRAWVEGEDREEEENDAAAALASQENEAQSSKEGARGRRKSDNAEEDDASTHSSSDVRKTPSVRRREASRKGLAGSALGTTVSRSRLRRHS